MASPAVAVPNGVALGAPTHSDDDHASVSSKRKRESDDEDEADEKLNGLAESEADAKSDSDMLNGNGVKPMKVDRSTIRDYFEVLQGYDAKSNVLKRPLPSPDSSDDEPEAKRKKADDASSSQPSIGDKVKQEQYEDLDTLIFDIRSAIKDQLAELKDAAPGKDAQANEEAIAKTAAFGKKALELFRREMTYPKASIMSELPRSHDFASDLQSSASRNTVLTVYGDAPHRRQLYTSLQQPVESPDMPEGRIVPLRRTGLPMGIKAATAMPFFFPSAVDKEKKGKTLGELFPAPRNLPSLQPPKAPKSTTKGVQVGWHRPELTEKSKYRSGSYFSQIISTGRWLDYSNAAPPSQIMTKQRERALSLAGNKPSSSDLEASELESLFRGAFSSFAPSKDDSAAMVSSGLISQTMWWQKVGKRNLDRLIDSELSDDAAPEEEKEEKEDVDLVDERFIEEAINDWDESLVDPSLEDACYPKKTDEEKTVDEILQDVSDMVQTLISYQKNRNLALPSTTNQSRYAADPAHSDMLTNGSPVQPGDEETATYEALKAQLTLIIRVLPPYAVARLNSDKLDELNISTALEVRTDEYQGVMDEDESAARARAAQTAASTARPTAHRASTSSGNLQYGTPQFPNAARPPMPSPHYYGGAQTPIRPPNRQQAPMPASYSQQRPPSTGYRPTNGYPGTGYGQMPKGQAYGQPAPYGATPTPGRPPYQQPGYPGMNNATPSARYPYTGNQPPYQQQNFQQHQQPPSTPSHPSYNPYPNGTPTMPQRTASPQVNHQQPQGVPQQGYNPSGTPSRQPPFGPQGTPSANTYQARPPYSPATGTPQGLPQGTPGQQQGQQSGNNGSSGFHTALNPFQVQQAMDQAKARFEAQNKAQRSSEGIRNSVSGPGGQSPGAPAGLGGIGLGGDPARAAAARAAAGGAGMSYGTPSPSPKPQSNSPAMGNVAAAVNGSAAASTNGTNGGTPPTAGAQEA